MTRTYVYRMLAVLTAALLVALLAVVMKSAEAAFPGKNGKIAFMSDRDGNEEVYVMNLDGSGPANLTNNPAIDLQPAFRLPARRSCSKPIETITPRFTR